MGYQVQPKAEGVAPLLNEITDSLVASVDVNLYVTLIGNLDPIIFCVKQGNEMTLFQGEHRIR